MAETLLTVDVEQYGQKSPKLRTNGHEDCWRSFLGPKDRASAFERVDEQCGEAERVCLYLDDQ